MSLRAICAGLAKKGYDISTTYVGREKDPAWRSYPQDFSLSLKGMWPRIWEAGGHWERALTALMESEKPDAVIVQQGMCVPTVEVCKRHGVPVVILLQGVDVFCLGSFWSGRPWKCEYKCVGCKDNGGRLWQFPFFRSQIGRFREAFIDADAVMSNSEFTSDTLKLIWGVDSSVATPISKEPRLVRGEKQGTKVLYFSPVAHKGVEIAVDIAELMKDEQFIFAGGDASRRTVRRIERARNIEYLAWIMDTDSLYERTKVLIMPSLIPEGFGRACAEAMRRGIPCIVSDVGALPETVGSGGDVVQRYGDANEWARVLALYKDPEYLAKKSQNALFESKRFTQPRTVDQMAEIIESLVAKKPG